MFVLLIAPVRHNEVNEKNKSGGGEGRGQIIWLHSFCYIFTQAGRDNNYTNCQLVGYYFDSSSIHRTNRAQNRCVKLRLVNSLLLTNFPAFGSWPLRKLCALFFCSISPTNQLSKIDKYESIVTKMFGSVLKGVLVVRPFCLE